MSGPTESVVYQMEYQNEYTDGAWKRTSFGHHARPVVPPKNFYDAQRALEDEALAWKRGTRLRIVEIYSKETMHAELIAVGGFAPAAKAGGKP